MDLAKATRSHESIIRPLDPLLSAIKKKDFNWLVYLDPELKRISIMNPLYSFRSIQSSL